MRTLGIVVLCILGYIGLQLYVHSARACSAFNQSGQCSSDNIGK